MTLSDIIHNVNELLAPYPVMFGVLYGYHTFDRELSVWAVKIALYAEGDYVFSAIKDMIGGIMDNTVEDENLKIINLKDTPDFEYYEILMTGKLMFVKDEEFFAEEKARAMKGYFDYLDAHNKLLEYSVKLLERRIYGKSDSDNS